MPPDYVITWVPVQIIGGVSALAALVWLWRSLLGPTLKRIKPPKAKPTYKPIPSTAGVVYVLRNKSMPSLLKIGFSKTSAEIRARSLSSGTNIPSPFEIVATFLSDDARQDESRVHQLLADHRVPGREFFQSSEADAISACEQVIGGAL